MKYDNSIREGAFTTYLRIGNLTSTAIACTLSADTVRHWARQGNWAQKLQAHREKTQRHILRELYVHQIVGLKEFIKRFNHGSSGESTGMPTDDEG